MGVLDTYESCAERVADYRKECTEKRDEGYNKCTEQRDEGYNQCTEKRDEGYNRCCTWWPCSWACKAWVWVSHIVCVVWTWISNIVCVVWTWISNIVCVAWGFVFYGFICVVWTTVVIFLAAPIVKLFARKGWETGHPPDVHSPEEAKRQVSTNRDTYKALSWSERLLGLISTPFKEDGVRGWTDYHLHACATGVVYHSAVSTDREHTIDIEIDGDDSSLTVDGADGISKPSYIRVEIFPVVAKDMPSSTIPGVGARVTICGELVWDADGFLEIHPEKPSDVRIL